MDLFHNYNVNTIKTNTKINLNLSLCIITHTFARLKINNLERKCNVVKKIAEIGSETSK